MSKDTEQQLPLVSYRRALSFSALGDGGDAGLVGHILMQLNA